MENISLSSLVFKVLTTEEMLNVRGGEGTTTATTTNTTVTPPIKKGEEGDIIL